MYAGSAAGLKRWPVIETEHGFVIGPPELFGPRGGSMEVSSVHPEGKQLVFMMDGYPHLMNLEATAAAPVRINHLNAYNASFSNDGRWLAMGTHGAPCLLVWRVGELEPVARLIPDVYRIVASFSPDGRLLAASVAGMVRLWRVGDWQPVRTANTAGGTTPVHDFSPDSRLLAYTSTPYEVCLEDVETGRQLTLLEATDDSQVSTLQFAKDGSQLILATVFPPTVRVWNLAVLRKRLQEIELADGLPAWPAPRSVASPKPIQFDLGLSAQQLSDQAERHRTNRQYAEACQCLEQCLVREPNQLTVIYRLAWLRVVGPGSVRNFKDAERLVAQVADETEQGFWAWNTRGVIHYRAGREVDALTALERAAASTDGTEAEPRSLNGFPRAMMLQRLGRSDEARAAFDEAAAWLAANRSKPDLPWMVESDLLQTEAAWVLDIRDR